MSRIGKMPVKIPAGVTVALAGDQITVKGPKGALERRLHPLMSVQVVDDEVRVARPSDEGPVRALHGLTRALIQNMVEGVTRGYSKTLEINGVGYRASAEGRTLTFQLGYSHPVIYPVPEGIQVEVRDQVRVVLSGCDKEQVGQVAANIRGFRPPDPYKAKGVMYAGERVRRKAGKAGRA